MATLFDNLVENIANVRSNKSDNSPVSRRVGLTLELRLPSGWPESGELEWCLRKEGHIEAHGSVHALADLPADVRDAPVHIWSSAEDTLLTTTALPTKSRAKIAKALPFALEDRLLSDPSDLFFTTDSDKNGQQNVSVTSKAKIASWISSFDSPDLQLRSITPETLAIPLLANTWALYCIGEDCWLRTGERSGFKCRMESNTPPHLILAALRQARERPDTLVLHNPPEELDHRAWQDQLGLEILTEENAFWDIADKGDNALNLLRDEFTPQSKSLTAQNVYRYRPAIYMMGIWLIGLLSITTLEWWQLNKEHRHLSTEMAAIFKASFPQEASVIVNPYQQMQANLARSNTVGNGKNDAGFLKSIGNIAPIVTRFSNAAITDIEYRNSTLQIGMKLPDYQTLENIKSTLSNKQVLFEVTRTRQKGSEVSVRLIIRTEG